MVSLLAKGSLVERILKCERLSVVSRHSLVRVHEAMADKGLQSGLISCVAENVRKSVGPDFKLGHWSFVHCRFTPEL